MGMKFVMMLYYSPRNLDYNMITLNIMIKYIYISNRMRFMVIS